MIKEASGLTTSSDLSYLNLPIRSDEALKGSEFVKQVSGLSLEERESAVLREILSGNVPSFSRKMRWVIFEDTVGEHDYEVALLVTCDYLAIGSDQDYLYIPMTPTTAQFLAEKLGCSFPTSKVVDVIYKNAAQKLDPQPIPPSDTMATVPVFNQHSDSIKQQIFQMSFDRSADDIVAGHKKDIIVSNKIYGKESSFYRVVIYGWHLDENNPIQPVHNGHASYYADYSHGVRFISKAVLVDGDTLQVDRILKDPILSTLLSNEGKISIPHYRLSDIH